MSSVNKVILVGHLGRDPEVRTTQDGTMVVSFSIATSEKYKDKQSNEYKQTTEWHNISVFGKAAEFCDKYLKKGSLVYVEGSIRSNKWTDKDGIQRTGVQIRATEVTALGSRSGNDQVESAPQVAKPMPARQSVSSDDSASHSFPDDSDIPF